MNMQCIVGNWRISYAIPPWYSPTSEVLDMTNPSHMVLTIVDNPPIRVWYAEILADDSYVFPDCGYKCQHCGKCLGCLRKQVFNFDTDDHLLINTAAIVCLSNPTGLHVPVPDDNDDSDDNQNTPTLPFSVCVPSLK